jgi:hypothetical protein
MIVNEVTDAHENALSSLKNPGGIYGRKSESRYGQNRLDGYGAAEYKK